MDLAVRQQQVLYDKKWEKFLRRTWLFRLIPFVSFAFAAGSMAMGNVREASDFDVIVGVRSGRIFTARFFCVAFFELFGWRRRKEHFSEGDTRDKVCLNHFVAPKAFRLSPPHNLYWKELYKNLVPIFGEEKEIQSFWKANEDWMGELLIFQDDLRYLHRNSGWIKNFGEWILSGRVGDRLERFLRHWQIMKIEKGSGWKNGYKPRVIYNDEELEFHPDTKRILEYVSKRESV